MLKDLTFHDTDPRVRRYIVPKRILLTRGAVENADILLTYRNRQIKLLERDLAKLTATEKEPAGLLLDFGTEFHGGAVLSVRKVEGDGRVRLSFGESAAEALSHLGEKGACNDHSVRDFVVSAQNYSTSEYAATGYRFLYIELLSPGFITLACVQGVAVYQPYEYIGSFVSSDEKLNRIYDVAAYTCHLCMQNELWDGIKRDRLIWIGDVNPELKTVKYVFGDVPDICRALAFEAEAAALPQWINKHPTYSLWWLIDLEEWSFYTGDTAAVAAHKDYIEGLTAQILENVDERGYFSPDYFLDWPSKAYPELSANGVRALLAQSMAAAAKLCRHLGNETLAARCDALRAQLAATRAPAGHLKQVAAMLLLNGMGDATCEKTLLAGGAAGLSTFMSYYIFTAMAKCRDTAEVLRVLREYYGAMLDLGATTFWEDFDIKWAEGACPIDEVPDGTRSDVHGDNGNYCYKGFRHSLCHGWSSGPVAFLTEHVLGVCVTAPGCRKIELTPHLGDLAFARGSIATPLGKVEISHEKAPDGSVKTVVKAPEGIEVTVK